MDFSFTEEQTMLRETTQRFVASAYSFDQRRAILASDAGWSRAVWTQLGELGLLAVNIPEADGGIGAGPIGMMLVSEVVGAGLLLEPFQASAVLSTHAIVTLGSAVQRQRWLPGLASGEVVAVFAHEEQDDAGDITDVGTRAVSGANGWILSGRKFAVYHAPIADCLLVSARVEDGTLALLVVPADAPGISRNSYRTVDGQMAADLVFDGVQVPADARLDGDVETELPRLIDYGIAALCAEAVGTLDRILKATIEYSRSRVQFGSPIGSFQALQHRMADMLMHVEQARSMAYLATAHCLDTDSDARRAAISGAKVLIGQAARHVGQEAVQLHGGMGMTDELDVSHCFKRLLAFQLRSGSTDAHLEACRRLLVAA